MFQSMRILRNCRRYSRLIATQNKYFSNDISNVKTTTPLPSQGNVSVKLMETIEKRLSEIKEPLDIGKGSVHSGDIDKLEEEFITAVDIGQIKRLIGLNYRNMQSYHIAHCFESINNILQTSSDVEQFKLDLLSSKEFEVFTNRSMKTANRMLPEESVKCLVALRNLDIQFDTVIVQVFLQMIRYQINDLTVPQLYTLNEILKSSDNVQVKTTLIDAIRLALPFVIKNQIRNKEVDFFSPQELSMVVSLVNDIGLDRFQEDFDRYLYKIFESLYQACKRLSFSGHISLLNSIIFLDIDSSSNCYKIFRLLTKRVIANIVNSHSNHQISSDESKVLEEIIRKFDENHFLYNQTPHERLKSFVSSLSTPSVSS